MLSITLMNCGLATLARGIYTARKSVEKYENSIANWRTVHAWPIRKLTLFRLTFRLLLVFPEIFSALFPILLHSREVRDHSVACRYKDNELYTERTRAAPRRRLIVSIPIQWVQSHHSPSTKVTEWAWFICSTQAQHKHSEHSNEKL